MSNLQLAPLIMARTRINCPCRWVQLITCRCRQTTSPWGNWCSGTTLCSSMSWLPTPVAVPTKPLCCSQFHWYRTVFTDPRWCTGSWNSSWKPGLPYRTMRIKPLSHQHYLL